MVVVNVKPAFHSLELLNATGTTGRKQLMVCACGWSSPIVDSGEVTALGRAHLREGHPPFFGFWREHRVFMPAGEDRRYNVLLMRPHRTWAHLFRERLDGSR